MWNQTNEELGNIVGNNAVLFRSHAIILNQEEVTRPGALGMDDVGYAIVCKFHDNKTCL